MRMKPLPKAIIVLSIVGAIGYGISQYLDYRKANPPAEAQAAPAPVAATPAQPEAAPVAPQQPSAAPPATSTNENDRGLNNLFKK